MRTVIVWWDLSESAQTIESLRTYLLDESVTAFAEVPGLRFKMWIADQETNRWGAVLPSRPPHPAPMTIGRLRRRPGSHDQADIGN
jgi:hypothetical protein